MNKPAVAIRKLYEDYASQFAQKFEGHLDTKELKEFISLLKPGDYVLDAGCGSCRDSSYMIKHGLRAVGVDISRGLLKEAKKIHPEVPTQQMDLCNLDFDKNTFHGVWCSMTIHHFDRKDIPYVLARFKNVLRPEGLLYILTKEGSGNSIEPVSFDPSLKRKFTYYTEKELTEYVERTGFRVLKSYVYNAKDRRKHYHSNQKRVVVFANKFSAQQ